MRGPQGTLYGRNATGGVINLITNRPSFDGTGGYLDVEAGGHDLLRVRGAVNGQIGDALAFRVAGLSLNRDGYTDNVCAGWNPEQYGLLRSTEQGTRDFYASLEPLSVKAVTSLGSSDVANDVKPRFIYQNVAAIEEYNTKSPLGRINSARLLDGPGGTPGTLVGVQGNRFAIAGDNVCLLRSAGQLSTSFIMIRLDS